VRLRLALGLGLTGMVLVSMGLRFVYKYVDAAVLRIGGANVFELRFGELGDDVPSVEEPGNLLQFYQRFVQKHGGGFGVRSQV